MDQEHRHEAATRFDRNLVVVAGAGTGKTALLVERFLNLLLSGTVELPHIVAITFTEKATNEMRERVAAGLAAVLGHTPPGDKVPAEVLRSLRWLREVAGVSEADLRARAARAEAQLAAAAISTIHSFGAEMLRRHPRAAGLPLDFTVDEGAALDVVMEELWPEFLSGELGLQAVNPEGWKRILGRHSQSDLEALARSLIRNPLAADTLGHEGYRPLDPIAELGPAIRDFLARYEIYETTVTNKNMRALLETAAILGRRFLEAGPEGLRSMDATRLPLPVFWERDGAYAAGKGTPDPELIETDAEHVLKLLQGLRTVDDDAFTDVTEILRRFAQFFRKRVLRDGRLVFEDLLLLARNLLRDHPEIRVQEAKRARYLLVDEFQDTDPLQYEIVFYLCADTDARIDDPYTVPLVPGKLFIVGDPKQSIYRFRGADITAYRRASDHVTASGKRHPLTANFRSVPGVLEPLNALFTWLEPADEASRDVDPGFEPLHATRKPQHANPAIEVWSVSTARGDTVEHLRPAEARVIARRLREWFDQGAARPCDVALLFRGLLDVPVYARALREAGIPFVVEGGRAFQQRQEVVEALGLIEALANPADPVATLGVLRSPIGGVPDADLLTFAQAGGRFAWNQRAGMEAALERVPRVRETYDRLKEMDRAKRSLPLDQWVLTVLTQGAFPLLMSASLDGPQRVANVRKLATRLAALVREQGLPLEPAARMLRDELEGERAQGESPLADESANAVRIMSIHKAKGLQFPIVIMPDISRKPPPDLYEPRIGVLRRADGLFLEIEVHQRGKLKNTAALIGKRDRKRHDRAEEKRVHYVAATRAENRLIFVTSATNRVGEWVKRLEVWGYSSSARPQDLARLADGRVLHRLEDGDLPPPRAAAIEPASAAAFVVAMNEATVIASRERPPRFRTPSADHRAARLDAVPVESDDPAREPTSRDLALAVGDVLHRLLEGWDFREAASVRTALPAAVLETARESSVDRDALRREVETVLNGLLHSPLPAHLAASEILGREIPILYRDAAGATVHGYADLVYRHGGRVHVADYKTDRETTRAQALCYREQLADYAATVQGALGLTEPPVAEVLFLRTGERVAVLD